MSGVLWLGGLAGWCCGWVVGCVLGLCGGRGGGSFVGGGRCCGCVGGGVGIFF